MYDSTEVIGYLGKEPELKYTANGTAVCEFSVAVSYYAGEGKDRATEWYNVKCWNRQAEVAGQYLQKGGLVHLRGQMRTRSWDGQDGQKKYRTELIVRELTLMPQKGDNQTQGGDIDPDDLPFET